MPLVLEIWRLREMVVKKKERNQLTDELIQGWKADFFIVLNESLSLRFIGSDNK